MEPKIRLDVLSQRRLSLEQNRLASAAFWPHLTLGKIKHKDGPSTLQRPCPSIPPRRAARQQRGRKLQSHRSQRRPPCYWAASDVFIQRAASAISFLRALAFFWMAVSVHSLAQFSIELPLEYPGNGYHNNYTDSSFLKCTWFIWFSED